MRNVAYRIYPEIQSHSARTRIEQNKGDSGQKERRGLSEMLSPDSQKVQSVKEVIIDVVARDCRQFEVS